MEHGQELRLDEEAVLQVDVLVRNLVSDLQLAVQFAGRAFSRHFEPPYLLEVVVDLEKEGNAVTGTSPVCIVVSVTLSDTGEQV